MERGRVSRGLSACPLPGAGRRLRLSGCSPAPPLAVRTARRPAVFSPRTSRRATRGCGGQRCFPAPCRPLVAAELFPRFSLASRSFSGLWQQQVPVASLLLSAPSYTARVRLCSLRGGAVLGAVTVVPIDPWVGDFLSFFYQVKGKPGRNVIGN